MIHSGSNSEERLSYILKAKKLSLLDAAFCIATYNLQYRPATQKNIELNEVFPSKPEPTLSDAYLSGKQLHGYSSSLVSLFNSTTSNDDLFLLLQEKFPGFSKDSYSSVIGRANYMAVK